MFLEMNYPSEALRQNVSVNVILPNSACVGGEASAPYKTLYLLHGLSGDHTSWMRNTAIERYAAKYNIAVVMPAVARSWYTDTQYGAEYFTFVSRELPEVCRSYFQGLSDKREDNFVAGLSMGGYGALKVALTYPENFAGCISLSGSLDITRKNRPTDIREWRVNFDFAMETPLELEGSEHDLFALARRKNAEGAEFPKIYLWCGTEDSLITVNRNFNALLNELAVKHFYAESEGNHSWKWWDLHIQNALEFMFK